MRSSNGLRVHRPPNLLQLLDHDTDFFAGSEAVLADFFLKLDEGESGVKRHAGRVGKVEELERRSGGGGGRSFGDGVRFAGAGGGCERSGKRVGREVEGEGKVEGGFVVVGRRGRNDAACGCFSFANARCGG